MAYLRLSHDDRRAQLLELGKRHFLARPYESISMDEVAEEARVSKGLLYHYFPTKREFYMACLRSAIDELLAVTQPVADAAPDVTLRGAIDGYLRYVEEHATAYQAVLRGSIGSDPEVSAIADGFREAIYRRIAAALPEPPGPLLGLAIKGWIGFVEAVSLAWAPTRHPPRAVLVDLLAGELAHVLQASGGAPLTPPS
jgi:AcrR family transcriptional regulator